LLSSCFSTFGVCPLTFPARASDPWTFPILTKRAWISDGEWNETKVWVNELMEMIMKVACAGLRGNLRIPALIFHGNHAAPWRHDERGTFCPISQRFPLFLHPIHECTLS
jgi:hypothetical protein